jgi:hypothetical protein
VVKIIKVEKPKSVRKRINVAEGLSVDLEYDGEEARVLKDGKVIAFVRGTFEEAQFCVEDYKVAVTRKELEEMLRES